MHFYTCFIRIVKWDLSPSRVVLALFSLVSARAQYYAFLSKARQQTSEDSSVFFFFELEGTFHTIRNAFVRASQQHIAHLIWWRNGLVIPYESFGGPWSHSTRQPLKHLLEEISHDSRAYHGGVTGKNLENHVRENIEWISFKTCNFYIFKDIQ
jgi:hypothetical protein